MSLRRLIQAVVLVATTEARAQVTDLNTCLSQRNATCQEASVGGLILVDCGRFFEVFAGRIAWYPLRYVGPITVEIESKSIGATRFPLYVEVVPLPSAFGGPCQNALGEVIMIVNGGGDTCGSWQQVGPLDLAHGGLLGIGQLYALRIHFFWQASRLSETPGIDCVRVTSSQRTPLAKDSWGSLKCIYR